MSVRATRTHHTLQKRSFLRHVGATLAAAAIVLWPAHSSANFHTYIFGTQVIAGAGNRYAAHEPVAFKSGANPADMSQYTVFKWGGKQAVTAEAWSEAPRAGGIATVHGQPHSIFQIPNLDTIGYVLDVKDPASAIWLPINDQVTEPGTQPGRRITFRSPASGSCCQVGLSIRVTFIKLGDKPFVNTLPQEWTHTVFPVTFRLLRNGKPFQGPSKAKFTIRIHGSSSTCTRTGATVQNIRLPDVSVSAFPAIGSTSGGGETARFSLKCDPGITMFATLTDANKASNTGDTLTNVGSAKGIGVQLLQTSPSFSASNCGRGVPCRFGPDSAAKGNTNQWQIGPNNSNNTAPSNPSISFQARYVRTGKMQPGDVRAVSTITFSYQ